MQNNILVQAIEDVPFGVVMAWIAGIVILAVSFILIIIKVYKLLEKYRKKRNAVDDTMSDFERLKQNDEKMEKSINAIVVAVRQILADRLDQRIKHYYALGFIPADEFENFQHQFTAYEGVGGNGEVKERYSKCIHDLPVMVSSNVV